MNSVRLSGVKGKNKQAEPGEASRDVFRGRLKQFWASLLSVASSCSNELMFEVGLLFLRSHSFISCYSLTFLISGPKYEEACFTTTHLLIPRISSSIWKHSWECCRTQILKLQGCGITDEMYVVLLWEVSGLWFNQCHSSVMCYAVATSWKFSETPCFESS